MLEIAHWSPPPGSPLRVGVVSTYPPTRCGIGRFTASLVDALGTVDVGLDVGVVRLLTGDDPMSGLGDVVEMEIDPASPVSVRAAARHLNRGDLAIINHEFGIFGPRDGVSVVDLARSLDVPALTVLHTVLPEPATEQRHILVELADLTTLVVICEAAADFLIERYGIDECSIEVIPHGAAWQARPVNPTPRRELITWGLLGPGKGLERAIRAIARLQLEPEVRYRIVGRTHPNVVRNAGYVYRDTLRRLVDELGVSDRVEFVDRYVDDAELEEMVCGADLVIVPYDNEEQVSSGVITEAIGLGRPVVATKFPYAEEMVGMGCGRVVGHDVASMTHAITEMLEDPVSYRRAAAAAAARSEELAWSAVATRYSNLIRALAPARATA